MTFSNSPSSGVALQGGGGSGGAGASAPLTGTGAIVTASQPLIDVSQTWNNAAVTFTGAKLNITDTASNAASLLMDLGTGGGSFVSKFSVQKNGLTRVGSFYAGGGIFGANGSTGVTSLYSTGQFGWTNAGTAETGIDLILTRRGVANLRLGAADAAGSAIAVNSVASNQLTLASAHGLTNGAAVQVTFTGGGAVPAGTAVNTTYYARSISAAVLELYGTYDQAITTASTTGRVSVTTAGTTAFINRATPFQTLSVQSFTGTDIPGQPFVITGSQGTGTGGGGDIIFQVAPRGTTGSTANALATALTINSSRQLLAFDGTAALPSYAFSGDATCGIYQAGGQLAFSTGGALRMYLSSSGFLVLSGLEGITITGSNAASLRLGVSSDVILTRDDANKLALRNGTAAQRFNVYNTWTSSTNYETFKIDWITTANTVLVGTEKGSGGGTARNLELQFDSTTQITLKSGETMIGAGGSPLITLGHSSASTSARIGFYGGVQLMNSTLGGVSALRVTNSGTTDVGGIQFGGTTSSFPAIKRSTTFLQARLADDSAFTNIQGKLTTETAYTAGAVVVTGYLTLYDSTGTAYRVPCLV